MTGASRPLVIGLGSPDRGDDAVGGLVAREVSTRLPALTVVEHEDPTSLLDVWAGHCPVVVVDAVRSGAPCGTVHQLETGSTAAPWVPPSWARSGSTHAFGLVEVVELARVLGRLPDRLVVVGVEAGQLDHGAPLSPSVAAAVSTAADRVAEALRPSWSPAGGPPGRPA